MGWTSPHAGDGLTGRSVAVELADKFDQRQWHRVQWPIELEEHEAVALALAEVGGLGAGVEGAMT